MENQKEGTFEKQGNLVNTKRSDGDGVACGVLRSWAGCASTHSDSYANTGTQANTYTYTDSHPNTHSNSHANRRKAEIRRHI